MSEQAHQRFVTACQQLLVLAVVAAVLTPAAGTISLDVRPPQSAGAASYVVGGDTSTVPTKAVDPVVKEYPLTAARGARAGGATLRAATERQGSGERVVSDRLPARGYATLGVTWAAGERVEEDAIGVKVRSRQQGRWSAWNDVEYHDDHAPDTDGVEAARARPGTDAIVVGDVDRVQVRVDARTGAPADLRLAVIDPGAESRTARQRPAIVNDDAVGTAGVRARVTPSAAKPTIYSRAQWGADERLRDPGSLRYGTVNAGFVHHTVNANSYTREDVPSILRGIYAYHTRSRGWSDVGYNFLVDRFGRIWEGRAGGVERPVVGAHTLGYNHESFAMSAIGNFETAQPSTAMLEAYAKLFAWKLGLHGINADDAKTWVVDRNLPAINGHRDAGSTACPGRYLYAKLGAIRTRAKELQNGWRGRELESDLAGSSYPDLVMRRQSDGRVVILPVVRKDGEWAAGNPVETNLTLPNARNLWKAGDWDRDGHGDLIVRLKRDDRLLLYRGDGSGRFAESIVIGTGFQSVQLLAAVGDFTGDGRPDLVGQPQGGVLRVYPGKGVNGLQGSYPIAGAMSATRLIPIGRWNPGGAPDVLVQVSDALYAYRGNGPGGLTGRSRVSVDIAAYNWFVGVSDVGGVGHADVIARERGTDRLFLLPAGFDGKFGARISLGRSITGYDLPG